MALSRDTLTIVSLNNAPALSSVIFSLREYGFHVYQCHSASELMEFLQKNNVAILLLNAVLPDIDVMELIAHLKYQDNFIQIILMAEFGDFELCAMAVEAGVDTFIQIPFTISKLLKRINWLLANHSEYRVMRYDKNDFRESIDAIVKNNIQKTLSQNELSEIMGISRTTLHRRIRKAFGISFQDYIDRAKLEEAKRLLKNRDLRVYEIAQALGFVDNNYYSRWFKQKMKMTPSEYRQITTPKADSVRIGALVPLTGIYGDQGESVLRGIKLGAEAAFYKLGFDIDVYPMDTASNPQVGARKAWEAAVYHDIHFFAGCVSSSVLQEAMKAVAKSKSILFGGVGYQTFDKNQLSVVFSWALSYKEAVRKTFNLYIKSNSACSSIYTITADYLFGHAILRELEIMLSCIGIEHRGNAFHSLGSTNFGSCFNEALKSGADTIVLINYGSDTERAIDYAYRTGISKKVKIITVWSNASGLIGKLGNERSENVYYGTQYWHDINLPANNDFIQNWLRNYGTTPNYNNACGYSMMTLYLTALEKNGKSQKIGDVREAMETLVWDGLTAPKEYMDPYTHAVRKEYYLLTLDPHTRKIVSL